MLVLKLSELPFLSRLDRAELPAIPAVYFLYGDSELLYIGLAKNLWDRLNIQSHSTRDAIFNYATDPFISWMACQTLLLRCTEKALIRALKPRLNHPPRHAYIVHDWVYSKRYGQRNIKPKFHR